MLNGAEYTTAKEKEEIKENLIKKETNNKNEQVKC